MVVSRIRLRRNRPRLPEPRLHRPAARRLTRRLGGARAIGARCGSGLCVGVVACEDPAPAHCGLCTCVGGGSAGNVCASLCVDDTTCVPSARCNEVTGSCVPDLIDGSRCSEDTDCIGGHCQNGFCCVGGDCEIDLDTNPACAGATVLDSVRGDDEEGRGFFGCCDRCDSGPSTQSGRGEAWFRIHVRDEASVLWCSDYVEVHARLDSPPGMNYDLYLYRDGCGPDPSRLVAASANGPGQREEVEGRVTDGGDLAGDDHDYFIEVRFAGGTSPASWTMGIVGGEETACGW